MRVNTGVRGLAASIATLLASTLSAGPAHASLAWADDPCENNGGQIAVAPDLAAPYSANHPIAYVVCGDGTLMHHGVRGSGASDPVLRVVGDRVVDVASTYKGAVYTVTSTGHVVAFGKTAVNRGGLNPTSGVIALETTLSGKGYWIITETGRVAGFGDAPGLRPQAGREPVGTVVGFAARGLYGGWLVTDLGDVVPVGGAPDHGSVRDRLADGDRAVGIVTDRRTGGFWVATEQGAVIAAGGAPHEDDTAACLGSRGAQPPFTGAVGDPYLDAPAPLWVYSLHGGICGFDPTR